MDNFPPVKQRPRMLALADALGGASTALRRDECDDWRINGSAGWIYAVPSGWQIYCGRQTAYGWTTAKKRFAFCDATQDGDVEGILFLDHLPNADEAATIRAIIGVRKRRALDEDQLAALRERVQLLAAFRAQRRLSDDRGL